VFELKGDSFEFLAEDADPLLMGRHIGLGAFEAIAIVLCFLQSGLYPLEFDAGVVVFSISANVEAV
jgi:hypothetical protein